MGSGTCATAGVEWNALTTIHAANARPRPRGLPLPARRVRRPLHPVHPDHRAGGRDGRGRDGAVDVLARPPALRPGGRPGQRPVGDRRAVRPLPDRRLRGVGAPRRRRRSTCRCSTSRSRTGSASRRASASTRRPAAWRSRSSTPATSTPATTSSSRAYKLGNIRETHMLELVASQQQRQLRPRQARHRFPRYCLECDVRFACHGGCPKDRFISDTRRRGRAQLPLRRLQGLLPPRRPADAAHVRAAAPRTRPLRRSCGLYAAEDARRGRNDPCTCGSGTQVEAMPRGSPGWGEPRQPERCESQAVKRGWIAIAVARSGCRRGDRCAHR